MVDAPHGELAEETSPVAPPAPQRPQGQDELDCAVGFVMAVLHEDTGFPDSALPSDVTLFTNQGYPDVNQPVVYGGQGGEVAVGDTLYAYIVFENKSSDCPGGAFDFEVTDINVYKNDVDLVGSMLGDITWPDGGNPRLMASGGGMAYGVFPFEVLPSDNEFDVRVNIEFECTGGSCPTGGPTFYDTQEYPTRLTETPAGDTFESIYGADPKITVVGPRAAVQVLEPAPGVVATPFQEVVYVIELTSQASGSDAITRITDNDPEAPLPQCRDITYPNDPLNPPGWFENPDGVSKVNTTDLSGPAGGAQGPLDNDEKLYCYFTVTMDPAIINDPTDSSFVLSGEIVVANATGQDAILEVEAPPVVISEAAVTIEKTVIDPDPADGVAIGEQVTYRIQITNTGEVDLEDFAIVDSLIGPVVIPSVTLTPDPPNNTYSQTYTYTVGLSDPSPLINTVSVEAHPVGSPTGFTVSDTTAASINVQSSELAANLILYQVDGVDYDEGDPDTFPRPGSVLTYLVQYCNNSSDIFRDLQYVSGNPKLIDGARPTYVDSDRANGVFSPGCYNPGLSNPPAPLATQFTYTVPLVTDPDFTDPVVNSVRVRAVDVSGGFKYADSTLVTNIFSDNVEISGYRYSIDTGARLDEDTAALRGETVYYHLDLANKSARNLCNIEVRQYIRNSVGSVVPGNPLVIPDEYIEWPTAVPGRINADGSGEDTAVSADTGGLRITYQVSGDTPDPLYRIFEVYAPSDCDSGTLAEPFIDRTAIITDISDVQVNSIVSVFAEANPDEPLSYGFRQPGLKYQFRYFATNVGTTFTITGLQYCVFDASGACGLQAFPLDNPDFFTDGNTFLPFQTREELSAIIDGPDGLDGDEPTPLRILVLLEGEEQGKRVLVRTLYTFPLLTDDLPGEITSGPEELVRGDGPAPYNYRFTNNTESLLKDVRVLNLMETGEFQEGVYEPVGVPGFPADTYYEVCTVHGDVVRDGTLSGTCNLTYHTGLPGGGFQMQVLAVGDRADDGRRVIGLGIWEIEELEHLEVTKTGSTTAARNSPINWTISVKNNSEYQPVDFEHPAGFVDEIAPEPPGSLLNMDGTVFAGLPDPNFVGFTFVDGKYRLPELGSASVQVKLDPPPGDGFLEDGFTNTATFVGETAPNGTGENVVGLSVTGSASIEVRFVCPITLVGFFIWENDGSLPPEWFTYLDPDPNTGQTVGEARVVLLVYGNIGSEPLTVSGTQDELFQREIGRPLELFNPGADVVWPNPAQEGYLLPGEFYYYYSPVFLRPPDFPDPIDERTFTWDAQIQLSDGPPDCNNFEVTWFYDILNPVAITKGLQPGTGLVSPGNQVFYDISMLNRSSYAPMFIQRLYDSILATDPLVIDFDDGTQNATGTLGVEGSGVEGATMLQNGLQDGYTVRFDDPASLVNIATVVFYMPSGSIVPVNGYPDIPASQQGPSALMTNVAEATVTTKNPLQITLIPSVEEVPAGGRFDIDVQVTNISTEFSLVNIDLTTGDAQLAAGLTEAGYPGSIPSLAPTQSVAYNITDPYYVIPGDYTEDELRLCVQGSAEIAGMPDLELPQVEACTTIIVLPPELEVTKDAFQDAACTIETLDEDDSGYKEVTVGDFVYYKIVLTNNSSSATYSEIEFTDVTNDGGDLSADVTSAFLTQTGGSDVMLPESSVEICVPYRVQASAQAVPLFVNTVTVTAVSGDTNFAVEDAVELEVFDQYVGISKSSGSTNLAFPGSTVIYTLTIQNRNLPDSNYYLIVDDVWDSLISGRLPGASYFDTCTGTPPDFTGCDPSVTSIPLDDPRWVWPGDVGVIPPGEQAQFQYEYVVQDTDPDPLENIAGVVTYLYDASNPTAWQPVEDPDSPPDPLRPLDETMASIAVTDSQLLVRKIATPGSALVGTDVTYQIAITNIGDRPVTNIQVVDCNRYTPCSDSVEPFAPGFGGQDLTGQLVFPGPLSRLDPFQTAVIPNYLLTMPDRDAVNADPTLDPFINTVYARGQVSVGGSGDKQWIPPGTDTAVVDLIVPGISVSKSASVGAAAIGDPVEYTIQVFNTGDTPVRLEEVTDVVPGDSVWTPLDTMKLNTCEDTGPDFTVGTDSLAPGEFVCATIEVVVGVPPQGSNEYVNTVRVRATIDPGGLNEPVVDGASAVVDVRAESLAVSKGAYCIVDGVTCITPELINEAQEGSDYQYIITIRNTGLTPLRELRISDAAYLDGELQIVTDFSGIGDGDNLLDPAEAYTFAYNYTVDLADLEGGDSGFTNQVTVVGVEDDGGVPGDVTTPRTAFYTVIFRPTSLEMSKVACVSDETTEPDFGTCVTSPVVATPGEYVWYQVQVTNPSAGSVNNLTVTDTLEGVLDDANDFQWVDSPYAEGTLPGCTTPPNCPTVTYTYRGSNPVSAVSGDIVNTAIARALAGSAEISAEDSVTVLVFSGELGVSIVEDAGITEGPAGTELNFTIEVSNSGAQPITNIEVRLPLISGGNLLVPAFDLPAGDSRVLSATYTIDNADSELIFAVTAEGLFSGRLVSDTASWTVRRISPGGLVVEKSADVSYAAVGDTITYTVTVRNENATGLVISGLIVQDTLHETFTPAFPFQLDPGQSETRQYTYTVTGTEGNPIENTVTAIGSVGGRQYTVEETQRVYIVDGDLLVTNEANTTDATVGDTVSFTYRICNISTGSSPTDDLTNVTLEDDQGPLVLPDTTLTPGQCFTVVEDVVVADVHVPVLTRTVTGRAETAASEVLTRSVPASVSVVPFGTGDIRLEVEPGVPVAYIGTDLELAFEISNVGDETLTITDFLDATPWYDTFNPSPVGLTLVPGQTITIFGDQLAAGGSGAIPITASTPDPFTGAWTVVAEDAGTTSYNHQVSLSLPVAEIGDTLTLSYFANPTTTAPGGTVNYTYTVLNISDVPITATLATINNDCSTYLPGTEDLWQPAGVEISPGATAQATATCEVDPTYTEPNVAHTVQVFDTATPGSAQDAIVIETPVEIPLGIEIIGSEPETWIVDDTATLIYRIFNNSTDLTITEVGPVLVNPSAGCDLVEYYADDTFTTPITFDSELSPSEEVYVHCIFDPVSPEFFDDGSVTVDVSVAGKVSGADIFAEASAVFDTIDLGLDLELTAVPSSGSLSQVVEGATVSFTLRLTNTGQSSLVLPPVEDEPVSALIYDPNDTSVVQYNFTDALYQNLLDECTWPLLPGEECIVAYNTITVPDGEPNPLEFTILPSHPDLMQATVMLTLTDEASGAVTINQESSWAIEVRRPAIQITTFDISPAQVIIGDTVQFSAIIQNTGFTRLNDIQATVFLEQVFVHEPGGVVLTSARRQEPVATITLTLDSTTLPANGDQTRATGSWTADIEAPATFRARVVVQAATTDENMTSVQDSAEAQFSVITDPEAPTTDPEGNPLDPDALDPQITKTVEPESAFPNQQMTFTIDVTNGSTNDMPNVTMIDAVPDAFPVVSASTTRGASIVSGQLVTVTTGRLGPGERVTITIVVEVGAEVDVPSLWTNVACAGVEGRDPVCAEAEVAVGAFGPGEGLLPTTGIGALDGETSSAESSGAQPLPQGFAGGSKLFPLLMLSMLLLLSASTPEANRRRWIIAGGAAVLVVAFVIGGVLLLGGGDDDASDDGGDTVAEEGDPTPTETPRATLARRPDMTLEPSPEATEIVATPTGLPFVATQLPSPTPYILPTASGPRRLDIPKLNFTRPIPIVELPLIDDSWDVSTLGHNVGWLEKTTWLNPDWGNTVLVAHVQIERQDPGPFYNLPDLEPGDMIYVLEGEERYAYRVVTTETVSATAIEVTHPTRDPILTLLTCTNWDMARGVYADRFIVRAEPVTSVQ
ncbi:MAG: DUF11 domain-containing protein [Chloroflexi bacterium]|nr:DUF11 domain-containing protein [Chloroflexota bacterium]